MTTTHSHKPPPHSKPPHCNKGPRQSKPPARKPAACLRDLDFWRFVLAALSLAWEIAKTWIR